MGVLEFAWEHNLVGGGCFGVFGDGTCGSLVVLESIVFQYMGSI